MPRFANMIQQGMLKMGHTVEAWSPQAFFYRLPVGKKLKKWLGYVDQFFVFPLQVRWRLRQIWPDTLFVFRDHALGPWVPLVKNRPHVIHVHDFMALRSSLGEFVQNPTGWSGRQYQAMIRRGFEQGQVFVSVSEKTRSDLHRFLPEAPRVSTVVYNGLNPIFRRMQAPEFLKILAAKKLTIPQSGFLRHVGGNQWYKNRLGVLEIYQAYVEQETHPLPLWMVGAPPTEAMKAVASLLKNKCQILFLTDLTDIEVCAAYSAASLMIFPSLAEGFGWPIAEAMTCGCSVLTTDEAPMTEVGGLAAFYIPLKPVKNSSQWAPKAARQVSEIVAMSAHDRNARQEQGFKHVAQFNNQHTMNAYEHIYLQTISTAKTHP